MKGEGNGPQNICFFFFSRPCSLCCGLWHLWMWSAAGCCVLEFLTCLWNLPSGKKFLWNLPGPRTNLESETSMFTVLCHKFLAWTQRYFFAKFTHSDFICESSRSVHFQRTSCWMHPQNEGALSPKRRSAIRFFSFSLPRKRRRGGPFFIEFWYTQGCTNRLRVH